MLEISGYDAGVAALDLTEVDLVRFLRATAAGDPSLTLLLPPQTDSLVIDADKRRLARVMANLLDNARRHGGGSTVLSMEHDEVIRIAVEDEGPGIPEHERQEVFDRFARGSASGRRGAGGGTGLGLSLVTEDLRLHRGRVWVEDRADGRSGARFVLELPFAPLLGESEV